jgi:uncharacterized protein (UPF0128 family)
MEEVIENLYFSIQTTAEKTYVGKIADYSKYDIQLTKDKKDKIIIEKFGNVAGFIPMDSAVLIVPVRTQNGVESMPVNFDEMPTGSSRVLIRIDQITEINAIDPDAPIVKAMRSLEANLIVSATDADVQNSSKIISKFGKR